MVLMEAILRVPWYRDALPWGLLYANDLVVIVDSKDSAQ